MQGLPLLGVLQLQLKSRSEPYELVLRKGASCSPTLSLLLKSLDKEQATGVAEDRVHDVPK